MDVTPTGVLCLLTTWLLVQCAGTLIYGAAFSCISTFNDAPGRRAQWHQFPNQPGRAGENTVYMWMKTRWAKNRFAERPVCCVVRIDPGRVVSHRLGEDSPHPLPFSQLFRCNPCRSFWYGPGVIKVSCRSRLKNKMRRARGWNNALFDAARYYARSLRRRGRLAKPHFTALTRSGADNNGNLWI